MKRISSLLLLFTLLAIPVEAALAVAQRIPATGGAGTAAAASTVVLTPGSSISGGSLITVQCSHQSASNISSIADSGSNTYAQKATYAPTANHMEIWAAYNVTGFAPGTITVTLAGSEVYAGCTGYEITGALTSSDPFNASSTGTSTGTTVTTGTITLVATSEIIVAMLEKDNDAMVAGSGYTLVDFGVSGDATKYFADEYKVVSANSVADASSATSANFQIVAASFKVASGAAAPTFCGGSRLLLGVGCDEVKQ